MLHLLKWDHQRDRRSRSWLLSIHEDRRRVHRQLRWSPGLKSQLDEALEAACEASSETGSPLKTFSHKRPFDYTEVTERPSPGRATTNKIDRASPSSVNWGDGYERDPVLN
jgi:Domain of unknown function DUF29